MGARGKKSASSLTVVKSESVDAIERPAPPSELTDEESYEWLTVTNRLPAHWFPAETHGLLVQYCRHRVSARRVSQLIQDFEKQDTIDVDHYDKLLKMQEREGRAISSLATRMRISQQSTIDKKIEKPKGQRKPWEQGNS